MGRTNIPLCFITLSVVLDIVITKDLVTPVYLTTCTALSSEHLPVLIEMRCQSCFLNPPDLRRTDWSIFHRLPEAWFPTNPELPYEVAIEDLSRNCQTLSRKRWQSLLESVAHDMIHGPQYRFVFTMKYA